MKRILLLICFCFSTLLFSQTNNEIASIYIKRSEKNFNEQKTSLAVKQYNKAMKYIDLSKSNDVSIPKLGMILFASINNYVKAKEYSKDYFRLVTDKTTDEYLNMLELYVDIVDKLDELGKGGNQNSKSTIATTNDSSETPKRTAQNSVKPEEVVSERITTSYSPRKTGGYTTQELAEEKAYPNTIDADKTYPFNANGISVFKKSGRIGLINDQGRVFLYPEEYRDFVEYDGYIILKNRKKNPTKLYCFNSNINFGFVLPSVREYNSLSSTYGKVMNPRGNGVLVTYPNNSLDVLRFDLNRGEFISKPSAIELMKSLIELGDSNLEYKVDESRDLLELKIDEEWVILGSPLGGDIYPLFRRNDYSIFGYAFSENEVSFEKRVMKYLGSYYDGRVQASTSKEDESWWLDKKSVTIANEEIIEEKYNGDSEIIRVSEGVYKVQNIAEKQ